MCLDRPRSMVLVPCGHAVLCGRCCEDVQAGKNKASDARGTGGERQQDVLHSCMQVCVMHSSAQVCHSCLMLPCHALSLLADIKMPNALPLTLLLRAMQMLGGGHPLTCSALLCCLLPVAHAAPNVPHSHRCCQGACCELSLRSGVQDQAQVGGLVDLSGAAMGECLASLAVGQVYRSTDMLHGMHGDELPCRSVSAPPSLVAQLPETSLIPASLSSWVCGRWRNISFLLPR